MTGTVTMWCQTCQSDKWTILRRWFMGRETVWWCDYCHEMIPTLSLVK